MSTISEININFSPLLKEIPGSPKKLYYRGALPESNTPLVAIVGTRKVTRDGREHAYMLASELAARGITIVSGLALGVDGAAHEGALSVHGKTIAVLANGLDTIYPKTHESLAERILENGGAIISEYPATTPPLPHRFLERNRIVSGLSSATILIEVPLRSGALVTARHALEQGREVFVVPGPARHPNYRGSHMLIRNGARLVTNTNDIIEDLSSIPQFASIMQTQESDMTEEEKKLFQLLQEHKNPLIVDTLIEMSKLDAHVVHQTLSYLILKGAVEESPHGYRTVQPS